MTADDEVLGVIAHGLLNELAVLSGAAFVLRDLGEVIDLAEWERTLATLESATAGFALSVHDVFDDAATGAVAAASLVESVPTIRHLPSPDVPGGLSQVIETAAVVAEGLRSLVRGLPPEVVLLLESLRR